METSGYNDIAARIRRLPGLPGEVRLVAIDGCGGAGKTTLALGLSAALGDCPVLHTDDFASWDHQLDWWPRMLLEALEPLSRGERAIFRRYDWDARGIGAKVIVEPESVVIVEGVSAGRIEWAHLLAFLIWVDTPRELRLRRGLERDGEQYLPLWHQWMAGEDDYVARDRPDYRADLVVDGVDNGGSEGRGPAALDSARPAAITAAACNRPGVRVSRSIGPDTDTAATT
jgi:uridine kinase